jgi:hypothetical protein
MSNVPPLYPTFTTREHDIAKLAEGFIDNAFLPYFRRLVRRYEQDPGAANVRLVIDTQLARLPGVIAPDDEPHT